MATLAELMAKLPTVAQMDAERAGKPLLKGKSRLEVKTEAKPLTVITEAQFKKTVRDRDKMRCRCCGRKTLVTLDRDEKRCEVHHVHGRKGVLRFEDRAALILCLKCHERVTGRVNDKLIIVGTATFELQTKREAITCIDARQPVTFVSAVSR